MKVKFLSTTNSSFKELEGIIGELHIGLTLHFDFNNDLNGDWVPSFDLRKCIMSSSHIKNIKYDEVSRNYYEITIETRNTVYVFGYGEKSDEKPLTDKELLGLQMAAGMHLF